MNIVFIIPTGIGAAIGGHAGDGTPAAKLIAQCCDKFITHPNVVNASDINEMPPNTLYVEGSMLDRFLDGEIYLREVYHNKILVAVNGPVNNTTINAVSAARATIGADISIIELAVELKMEAYFDERGVATGNIHGEQALIEQVKDLGFDVLAIHSKIDVSDETALAYLNNLQ